MKKQFVAGLFAAAMMTPAAALAQDSNETETFIGVSAGYHDLGLGSGEDEGLDIDDASPIFGVVAGVDFPVSDNLFLGVEGNFHIGTDATGSEYGGLIRFGYRADNGTKVYLRSGNQWTDLDLAHIVGLEDNEIPQGVDDTIDDYLLGAGVDIPLAGGKLRFNVDTVSFDTIRGTTGFVFSF